MSLWHIEIYIFWFGRRQLWQHCLTETLMPIKHTELDYKRSGYSHHVATQWFVSYRFEASILVILSLPSFFCNQKWAYMRRWNWGLICIARTQSWLTGHCVSDKVATPSIIPCFTVYFPQSDHNLHNEYRAVL